MKKKFTHSDHIKWCCEKMKQNMYNTQYPLDLYISTRSFCLPIMWPHGGPDLRIDYCPFCRKHLPTLEDKWRETLKKEYNIEDFFDPKIPSEFYTEDWWVKRGL